MNERVTTTWGGRTLTMETGQLAKQANGSVLVRYGETVVLVTAVFKKTAGGRGLFSPLS